MNVLDTLQERGFIQDCTDSEGLRKAFDSGPVTLYQGFDPTAASLHAGSLMGVMMLKHFQLAGHRPIALLGGGTALIGDPSGKTSVRKVLTREEIQVNQAGQDQQFRRYLDFEKGSMLVNNADWLTKLNYIEFLRDVGRHFSVNHMLGAEVYKTRLDSGLNFVEFNYMLLQAYDFLHLYREMGCVLQIGGSDQWSNILAGTDLIRREESAESYGLVCPLLSTASGQKMGKTEKGAVWLDAELTSPYDFYQYWINVEDADVERFLAYFTFLPMEEVRRLGSLQGADLREAKEVLAHEATAITHGKEAADHAQATSRALFSGQGPVDEAPAFEVASAALEAGLPAFELFADAFGKSRREARDVIKQGGAYIDGQPVQAGVVVSKPGLLRWGKKEYRRLVAG